MRESQAIRPLAYRDFSRRAHERAASADRVIKAQLELTYRCNLHCVHCYTDPYNAREYFPRELTCEEIVRLLDDMKDLGILWLNLSGGEILTHPNFFEIYDEAYSKGFLLQLYTNGTVLTEAIIERLKMSPPFSIDISCHSVDEQAFDWFTKVPGSFKRFLKGMELLRRSGLPFCFRTKAMNWNKDELLEIKRFVESFGQQFGYTTSLSPRLNGDCSSLAYRLAPEDVSAIEDMLKSTQGGERAGGDNDDCPLSEPTSDHLYRCGCGTSTIHINAWGELGTCTLQYERRVSLRDYSLGEAIQKVFSETRELRYTTDSPCKTCNILSFCDKKPTDARWEMGEAEAPIPYNCDVALARAERALQQPLIHPLRIRDDVPGA